MNKKAINIFIKYDLKVIIFLSEEDFKQIHNKDFLKNFIKDEIIIHTELILAKTKEPDNEEVSYYDIPRGLEYVKSLNLSLEELKSSSKPIVLMEMKYHLGKNKIYIMYLSEKHFRVAKKEYILNTFWYNSNIVQDKELIEMTEPNKTINNTLIEHNPLTEEEFSHLRMFTHHNQTLFAYDLIQEIRRKIKLESTPHEANYYNKYTDELLGKLVHNEDLYTENNFNIIEKDFHIQKINGFFQKEILEPEKYGLYVPLTEAGIELYFEANVLKNNLCIIHITGETPDTPFSFNCSLEAFLYLILFIRDNINFYKDETKENFTFPQLNLLDENHIIKLFKHITTQVKKT